MTEEVEKLAALFRGFASAHGTHGEPHQDAGSLKWAIKRTAKTLREPVTQELWEKHVAGERPLGIIAIREDSTCYWGSIDYDVYDANLTDLLGKVQRAKFPLVPCRSKSGGLHLFLFLAQPQPATEVMEALEQMSISLGIAGSEVFPKQKVILEERGDLGSWMVMPYFGGTYGGRLSEQVGLRPTGAELTLAEFVRAAEKAAIDRDRLDKLRVRRKRRTVTGGTEGAGEEADVPFGDGPVCLQHLTREGISQGGQNNALFQMGVYFKRAFPDSWETKLEEANFTFLTPPGSAESLQSLKRSLKNKNYEYKCSDQPMAGHCDARRCRQRRFGVSGGGGEYPEIGGLSVLKTDPVIWFVDVDGDRVEISTPELQNYAKFHAVCMEKLRRCYSLMKQDTWIKIVAAAMENAVSIEPPPDALPGVALMEQLETFLTNRSAARYEEDLLSGRPWHNEDGARYEFRLRDFQDYLRRERKIDPVPRPGELTQELQKMGAEHGFKHVSIGDRKHGVNLWYIPDERFVATPQIPLPLKAKQEEAY